jgi:hypothetical protein
MKRSLGILCIGMAAAVLAYSAVYLSTTASSRQARHSDTPELLWLKQEFSLNDADFQRICGLHNGYLPRCRETCSRIAAENGEIRAMLAKTNTITPEIERKLAEVAQLRSECQKAMLEHFYEVSRVMPPAQGRRYLDWIQYQTLGDGGSSSMAGHQME